MAPAGGGGDVAGRWPDGGILKPGAYTDERITPVIAAAIVRAQDGRVTVRMTQQLAVLRAETPAMWFVAEDDDGRRVSFGQVPAEFAASTGLLRHLSYGHVRDRFAPHALSAVIRREDSPAGLVTILGHGKLVQINLTVIAASGVTALPIFLVMVVVSLVVIPWIVRRSLAGVARIAHEAEQIDAGRRGMRLSDAQVPPAIDAGPGHCAGRGTCRMRVAGTTALREPLGR